MNEIERGQVSSNAAEVYDEFFVPALFEEWAERVIEAAQIKAGQRVVDIACGTGVLAAAAAAKVDSAGSVVGIDVNEGMLAVARRNHPSIEWRQGDAEKIPFPAEEFDAVISQFGLMFFENMPKAIDEMVRVLRPGGHLAIAVWDSLSNTPGYAAVTEMLGDLFGEKEADSIRVPYELGDKGQLRELFDIPQLTGVEIATEAGIAKFPSIEAWMFTDVNGWTLAGMLSDEQYDQLLSEAEVRLQPFVQSDGTVRFPAPAHIVTGRKRTS